MTAVLTGDMPLWLALLFLGVAVAVYVACGVLALIGRRRRTSAQRRAQRSVLARAGARREVAS